MVDSGHIATEIAGIPVLAQPMKPEATRVRSPDTGAAIAPPGPLWAQHEYFREYPRLFFAGHLFREPE